MTSPELEPEPEPTVAALRMVVQTLEGQLREQGETLRRTIREQNAALQNALKKISRLTVMVEGVTQQLSVLLGEQAEKRRAEPSPPA